MRIVALFTVFNEQRCLARALGHLLEQGLESYIIDNESTDDTLAIAQSLIGRGVIGVETLPRHGRFALAEHLERKQRLHHELGADWYIHHDADEIRQAPRPYKTLAEGIAAADAAGCNAIDFDEFVFLPMSDEEDFDNEHYVERMRRYCYLCPPDGSRFRINAWKNFGQSIDLVSTAGHQVRFVGRKVFATPFVLRHYIVLSKAHALRKYRGRAYSESEVLERVWHGPRAFVEDDEIHWPDPALMHTLAPDNRWDKSRPVESLPIFAKAQERYRKQRLLASAEMKLKARRQRQREHEMPATPPRAPAESPPVDIVIVNWNGRADTLSCLESLGYLNYPNFRVIVVDNGSTDGSADAVRAAYPQTLLIEAKENLGFTGGNNLGLQRALEADAEFALMLNNDTTVHTRLLDALVDAAQAHPTAGIFGAKVLFAADPRVLQFAGGGWSEAAADFGFIGRGELDELAGRDQTRPSTIAYGCAMMLRTAMLRQIGLLDDRFYLSWEEVDLCYRARAAGYETLFVPDARVWHKGCASTVGGPQGPLIRYYHWRNRMLWMRRHLPAGRRLRLMRRVLWPLIWADVRDALKLDGDPQRRLIARSELLGLWHHLCRRYGPAPPWLIEASANFRP